MTDDDTPRDDREELADLAADLESVLRDLRTEIEPDGRRGPLGSDRRRGPFGFPRPPEPRRVLRFADEVAIPATIVVLEANVKLLQALQRGIRMTESGRRVREEGQAVGDRAAEVGDRAADVSRSTLDRLGSTLEDLQDATARGGTPESGPARELIEEARRLRDEIDQRLRDAQGTTTLDDFQDRGERDDRDEPDDAEPEAESAASEVHVDVDAELDSLKEQYADEDEPPEGGESGDASEGSGDGDDDENRGDGVD
jgi:hypothetical protein